MRAEELRRTFQQLNSGAVLYERGAGDGLWDEVLADLSYIPIAYTRSSLDYQAAYMRAFLDELIDLSLIIRHGEKPIGVWPLSLRRQGETYTFATNQGGVLPPLYRKGTSPRLVRKYDRACLGMLQDFRAAAQISLAEQWETQVPFLPTELREQNIAWEELCMERGGRASVVHDLYVDLSLPLEEIHRALRKSYQSLLHEGERLWRVEVHDRVGPELFDEYRLLHQAVAGRVTRPLETWNLQRDAINGGEGFLVTLRDGENRLVGGGLFSTSPHEGSYGVGVYDRSLFDKPVSHVVQWQAIKHLKELGRRWHYIGQRFYPGDLTPPTEKELSIAHFKEGFATHMFLRLLIVGGRVPTR